MGNKFRAFTLYNIEKTDYIELNDLGGYLVSSPTGLGIYLNNSYLNVGTERILTGQTLSFRPITLTIDIVGGTRQAVEGKYNDLRDFIAKYKRGGFRLAYKPHEGSYVTRDGEEKPFQERYIECDIKDFDKTEKATSRYMPIPVNIEPRTYWRIDETEYSTEVIPTATNMFEFKEQGYNTPINYYDVEEVNKTGEVEFTISGYDKTELPQGVALRAFVTDNAEGVDFDVNISLDGATLDNGVLVIEKSLRRDTRDTEQKFALRFDPANGSVKAICELWVDNKTDLSPSLYDLDLREGMDDSVAVFEFSGTAIDDVVEIWLYWEKHDGTTTYDIYRKAKGDKYLYITLEDFAAWDGNNTNTVKTVESVNTPVYNGVTVADMFTWSVVGKIAKGSRDYAAGFLYDAEAEEYNIALNSSPKTTTNIVNDGDHEIPLRVCIRGAALNPTVKITPSGSGQAVQTAKVNVDIPAGAYVEINSDPKRVGAWIVYQGGVRQNVTGLIDQSTNMFLTLPVGEYDIEAYDEGYNAVEIEVFVRKEYLGA